MKKVIGSIIESLRLVRESVCDGTLSESSKTSLDKFDKATLEKYRNLVDLVYKRTMNSGDKSLKSFRERLQGDVASFYANEINLSKINSQMKDIVKEYENKFTVLEGLRLIRESVGKELTEPEVVKRLGVSREVFDAFIESINTYGIFGRKLEGYKTESFAYKYVEFTNKKKTKFTLVSLKNVELGSTDTYYKINNELVLIFD
jgi:hypothetical protein